MVCASRFDERDVRVVTNVKRVAVDAGMGRETSGTSADGEAVWFWRAHAGAKSSAELKGFARMTVATGWFTGKSTE
ncbi:MAG TPA: hypothetical protein VKY22_21255 [Bradyrhizobium sp.]|nr:hypothetical protein [Bradyrhizobium sp.]